MSTEYELNVPIDINIFKQIIIENNGIIESKISPNTKVPHLIISYNNNFIYCYTNENKVTNFTRYGLNDPTWLIDIMKKYFSINMDDGVFI